MTTKARNRAITRCAPSNAPPKWSPRSASSRPAPGLHSGEVVIGNVGSSDKMEFTVLGNTVNLASRLESLNKEQQNKIADERGDA